MSDSTTMIIAGIAIIAIGIYCICAAVFNWNWFFNNNRAILFVKIFKRKGARIFYAVLGAFFAGIGIFFLIGKFLLQI